ncbi:MAG: hypothetical protein RBU23_10900, partial [Candidatus Auribacterota bacterium]|nr:hypothetical protein [Candidatus Auribacterota bacterium]
MNSSNQSQSPASVLGWYAFRKKYFWFKVVALIMIECFLFDRAMIAIAQENSLSPPDYTYQQEQTLPDGETQPDQTEQPFQPQGQGILPGLGWETPMFQSTDAEVEQDAQLIRDEILSADTPPQPSTDITDYIDVLDIPGLINNPTLILFSYTDESDPENEGLLTQVVISFENKPDDITAWEADNSAASPDYGNDGKVTYVEYEYARDTSGNVKYFQVDVNGNFIVDGEGQFVEVASDNEGSAMVVGIRLMHETDKGIYALFDYSTGTRQYTIYDEVQRSDGSILRLDPAYDTVIYKKASNGVETWYTYNRDAYGFIDWYETYSMGVTRHYINGEDQNFNELLDDGEDLDADGLLDPWVIQWIKEVSGTDVTITYYENGLISHKVMPDGKVWWFEYEYNSDGVAVVLALEERINSIEIERDGSLINVKIEDEDVSVEIQSATQVLVDGYLLELPVGESFVDLDIELLSGTTVTFRLNAHGQLLLAMPDAAPVEIAATKTGLFVESDDNPIMLYRLLQEDVRVTRNGNIYSLKMNADQVDLEILPDGSLRVGTQIIALGEKLNLAAFGYITGGADYGYSDAIDGGLTISVSDTGRVEISILNSHKLCIGHTLSGEASLGVTYYGGRVIRQDENGNIMEEIDYSNVPPTVTTYKYILKLDGTIQKTMVESNGVLRTYDDVDNLVSVLSDGVLIEYRLDGLEHRITYIASGITKEYIYEPEDANVNTYIKKTEVEHDPEYPDADIIRVFDYQKGLLTSVTDRNGYIRKFEYYNYNYTEDLNGNGIIDPPYSEDLNGNGYLDDDEDIIQNGILDTNVIEDRNNDGILNVGLISGPERMVKDYLTYTIHYYIETRSHVSGDPDMNLVFEDMQIIRVIEGDIRSIDPELSDDQLIAMGLLKSIDWNGNVRNFKYEKRQIDGVERSVSIETLPQYPNFELVKAYNDSNRVIYKKEGDLITRYAIQGNVTIETASYASGAQIDGAVTWVYDDKSNLISQTDRNGNIYNYSYSYDSLGNLYQSYETAVTFDGQPMGITTRQFDVAVNVVAITDRNGVVRSLNLLFDEKGNKVSYEETDSRYPDLSIVRTVDNDGRILTEQTIGTGGVVRKYLEFEYEIDPAGEMRALIQREIHAQYTRVSTRRYNYHGELESMVDWNGMVTHYSYLKDTKENVIGTVISHPYKESDFFTSIPAFAFENPDYGFIISNDDGVTLTNRIYNLNAANTAGSVLLKKIHYADMTTNQPLQVIDYLNSEVWTYTYDGTVLQQVTVYNLKSDGTAGDLLRTISYTAGGEIDHMVAGDEYITFSYTAGELASAQVRYQSDTGKLLREVTFQNGNVYRVDIYNDLEIAERWLEYSYRSVDKFGEDDLAGAYTVIDSITEYNDSGYASENRTRSVSHPSGNVAGVPFTAAMQFSKYTAFIDGVAQALETVQRFDIHNDLVVQTDEDGVVTSYEYERDAIGNIVRSMETSSLYPNTVLEKGFDSNSMLVSQTSRSGFVYTYNNIYDNEGRLQTIEETSPLLPDYSLERTFDHDGRLASINSNGKIIDYSYEFDSLGNVVRSFETNGDFPEEISTRQFDVENGNMGSYTDQYGNITKYVYNDKNDLVKTELYKYFDLEHPSSVSVYYTSGAEKGQVKQVENEFGNIINSYTYQFDSLGNLLSSIEKDGPHQGYYPGYEVKRTFNPDLGNVLTSSDHNGSVFSYNYDDANRLSSITDSSGNITVFYTSGLSIGQVASTSNTTGLQATYSYEFDNKGGITKSYESAAGFTDAVTTRSFDSLGRLTSIVSRNGSISSFYYDQQGKLESTKDNKGNETYFFIGTESDGKPFKIVTDGEDLVHYQYEFDTFGNLTASYETNADFPAAITTRAFDTTGNIATMTAPQGIVTSFSYTNSILTSTYDQLGNVVDYYTAGILSGNVAATSDTNGLVSTYTYEFDSQGNLTASYETNADFPQAITTREFNVTTGNIETSTDKAGTVSSFYYADGKTLLSIVDTKGVITEMYTDGNEKGQAYRQSDATGLLSEFSYEFDSLGTISRNFVTDGTFPSAVTTRQFDVYNGNIQTVTDKNGVVSSFIYDNDGRILVSVVDTRSNITAFYTSGVSEGQVLAQFDNDGLISQYSYEFDTLNGTLLASFETDGKFSSAITTRRFDAGSGNLDTVTDKNGSISSFYYDGQTFVSVVDDRGNITTFYTTTTAKGQVLERSGTQGLVSSFTYDIDELGNVLNSYETDGVLPAVITTRSFQPSSGNIYASTDRNGVVSSYDYINDDLVSVYDTKGNITFFYTTGDFKGQVLAQSDNYGLLQSYTYEMDSIGNMSRAFETDGTFAGAVSTRQFDVASGTISTVTDKNGVVSTFYYDGDTLVSIADDKSNITEFYTDGTVKGQISKISDAGGLTAVYDYEIDTLGNMLASFITDGNIHQAITTRRFDTDTGNISTSTDKNGTVSSFYYDASVMTSIVDDSQKVTAMYTSGVFKGQVEQIYDENGIIAMYTYEFDTIGNMTKSFETDGTFTSAVTTRAFDTQTGNMTTQTDRNGSISSFMYDGTVMTSIIDDKGGVTELYTSTDAKGQVYRRIENGQIQATYSYDIDSLGNMTASFETNGAIPAAITTRTFNVSSGNIVTSTDKNGLISSYYYDDGILASVVDDEGNVTSFYTTGQEKGQLYQILDNAGLIAQYTYQMDSLGNVVDSYATDGQLPAAVSTRHFDVASGNVVAMTDKNGSVSSFAYDSVNNLVSIFDDLGNVTDFYTDGAVKGQVRLQSDKNGLSSIFSYELDTLGNTIRSFETNADFPSAVTTRMFDVATGNISTVTDPNGRVTTFDYDGSTLVSIVDSAGSVTEFYTSGEAKSNIKSSSDSSGPQAYFSYDIDTLGNVERSYQTNAKFPSAVTTRHFNTTNGNIFTATDANGNVSSYHYDDNVLLSISGSDGNVTSFFTSGGEEGQVQSVSDSGGLVSIFSYEMDTFGNITRSFETDATYPAAITTRRFDVLNGTIDTITDKTGSISSYYYDGTIITSVLSANGGIVEFYTSGNAQGQVHRTSDNSGLISIFSYEMDTLGNVMRSFETDAVFTGAVTTRSFNIQTGAISTVTDKNGSVTSFLYSDNTLVSIIDEKGNVSYYYTDGDWKGQLYETSSQGVKTATYSYEISSIGDLITSYETNGKFASAISTRRFDPSNGTLQTFTDRNNNIVSYYYDSSLNMVSIIDGSGNITDFYTSADAKGQAAATSDLNGLTAIFSYEFDTIGNLVRSFQTDVVSGNALTTRQFDTVSGSLQTVTGAFGRVSSFHYDSLGDKLVSMTDDQGSVVVYYTSGDAEGQLYQSSSAGELQSTFAYEFDTLGNISTGYETANEFGGMYTTRRYDTQQGTVVTSTDHFGSVSSFAYDSNNVLVSIYDDNQQVTLFYTSGVAKGQVAQQSNYGRLSAVYSYEMTSGAVSRSFETSRGLDGQITTRQFNLAGGTIETTTDSSGLVSSFHYDSLSRLASIFDSKNYVTRFYTTGDAKGQVESIKRDNEFISQFTYDIDTGRVAVSYETAKGTADRLTTRRFDLSSGTLSTVTDWKDVISSFDYDNGLLISISDSKDYVNWFYTAGDAEGQLYQSSKNGTLMASYTYDMQNGNVLRSYETERGIDGRFTTRLFNTVNGNVLTSTDRLGQVMSFNYDNIDRLVSVWDTKNNVTKFYTDGDYEGQVSETSKNGSLTAMFSYEMTTTGDVSRSFETLRGDLSRISTRAFNLETGNIATSTDRFGQVMSFDYDTIDRLVSVWDAKNEVTKFYTDEDYEGQVSQTSKNGYLTAVFSYEMTTTGDVSRSFETSRGDLSRISTRAFNLDTGNIDTSTDRFGVIMSFDYAVYYLHFESVDRLVSVWDTKNNVTKFYTDGDYEGQVSQTSKNGSLTAVFSYEMTTTGDVSRSFETSRGDTDRISTRAFNLETGNIATSTDRFGQVMSFDYDTIDRLVSVWDTKNAVTKFYTDGDYEGQVSETSKNGSLTAVFSYEMTTTGDVSRSFETSRGDTDRISTRAFNLETGNIATSTDRFGQVMSFDYDTIDRLVSVWDTKNAVTKFYT